MGTHIYFRSITVFQLALMIVILAVGLGLVIQALFGFSKEDRENKKK